MTGQQSLVSTDVLLDAEPGQHLSNNALTVERGREFSFHALDRQIRALPDGPTDHRRPRWMTPLQVVGALGVVIALTPSFLILSWKPAMWMAYMARSGVLITVLGWAPQFVFDSYWVIRSLISWRSEQTRTMDYEFRQFGQLQGWLSQFPKGSLEEHARFATAAHGRLTAKLGFIAGGFDKIAVIPLLALIAVQAKVFQDFSAVPMWQVYVGLFAAVTYVIAIVGHLMKLQLGFYEAVLLEALIRRSGTDPR